MVDVRHYTYSITWDCNEEDWVATCAELRREEPAVGGSPHQALGEALVAAQARVEQLVARAEIPPVPLSERPFSGCLSLRIPSDLHRRLAIRSAREGLSLNRWLTAVLARETGEVVAPVSLGPARPLPASRRLIVY